MDFQIVPITSAHIDGFAKAVDRVAREGEYLGFIESPAIEVTKAFVMNNIKGHWPHLVALHNQEVIGWCDISSTQRQASVHAGELGVGVIKAYRGQGVGKALIKTALETAKSRGLTRIEITVRDTNQTALNLYEQFGFEKEGLHKNAICLDGTYSNTISMALLWI